MKNNLHIKITIFLHIFILTCFGQSELEKNLKKILNSTTSYGSEYLKQYIRGYMQPFATAFGTSICGGMYHRATIKSFPRFDAGISAVYLTIPDEGKKFSDLQNHINPTVFGSKILPNHDSGLPAGTGLSSLLIPQIHINLGLISNFEITGRYLIHNFDQLGDISLLGFGVKYGFGEFIPLFPIDLSVQAMYHKFTIDEWLNSGTFGMNIQLSKDFPIFPFDIYGGIGFENTSMIIKTGLLPSNNILDLGDITIDGENNYRFNIGISWTLSFFNLHADYNFSKYNSLSFGGMIVF